MLSENNNQFTLNVLTIIGSACLQEHYQLTAVISHIGQQSTSGHYIATVRERNGWVVCDDDKVSVLSLNSVLHYRRQRLYCN